MVLTTLINPLRRLPTTSFGSGASAAGHGRRHGSHSLAAGVLRSRPTHWTNVKSATVG